MKILFYDKGRRGNFDNTNLTRKLPSTISVGWQRTRKKTNLCDLYMSLNIYNFLFSFSTWRFVSTRRRPDCPLCTRRLSVLYSPYENCVLLRDVSQRHQVVAGNGQRKDEVTEQSSHSEGQADIRGYLLLTLDHNPRS